MYEIRVLKILVILKKLTNFILLKTMRILAKKQHRKLLTVGKTNGIKSGMSYFDFWKPQEFLRINGISPVNDYE